MSAARNPKQTLVKKLSSKASITVPQKREGRPKPELFAEIKNIKKTAEAEDTTGNGLKNRKKTAKKTAVNVKTESDGECVVEPQTANLTSKSNKLKHDEDSNASSLELSDTKLKKISSKLKSKKIPSKELPTGSNKDVKQEQNWEPFNWPTMLDNIRTMRSKNSAPVDTMGCHKCADQNADEKTQRFHKLVALMLSSQTKDESTYQAMLRLREHTLTPETICAMKINVLENTLHPVSFYKNKAKYLQQTSKILIDKYDSDIPNNIKELVALPGVGPKMAHICMATAWHETTGIGVDVHVHRICNRLQWVAKPTKEPEQTRVALESWLPRNLWQEVNHLLVGFGQTTCTPLKPKCIECLNCNICPEAIKNRKSEEKLENDEILKICGKSKFKKTKIHL